MTRKIDFMWSLEKINLDECCLFTDYCVLSIWVSLYCMFASYCLSVVLSFLMSYHRLSEGLTSNFVCTNGGLAVTYLVPKYSPHHKPPSHDLNHPLTHPPGLILNTWVPNVVLLKHSPVPVEDRRFVFKFFFNDFHVLIKKRFIFSVWEAFLWLYWTVRLK